MKYVPFAVVLVVLGLGTYIEGKYSDRFGRHSSAKLQAFTQRLKEVPKVIGEWTGVDDQDVNMEEFKASNCDGFISRTYTNREGQRVSVYLVSGSARHVTIHTPDWCYVAAGFQMNEEPQQYSLGELQGVKNPPEFLTTKFIKEDPLQTNYLRIFWAFSDNGDWIGPRMARPAFAGRSAMYKIYVITQLDSSIGADIEDNPSLDFLRSFVPQANAILFKESDSSL